MMIKAVLAEVLKGLKPDKDKKVAVLSTVKSFLDGLRKSLKSRSIRATVVLGGSFAKDVWLAGDFDVDVFVKFHLNHKAEDISTLLETALKPFKPERVHGSRDYFWVKKNKINFEVIPVLAISRSEQAENVTDFSPLHVDWVNKNSIGLKDDIRLMKQFCKAAGVYGAESYINGFSGHVVDVLVIHFDGFLNLLKAASKWKTEKKIIIDHYDKYKGRSLLFLNKSKTEGPLVIVDPVQPERNAAAALSLGKLKKFIKAARSFLKKPSVDFFKIKPVDVDYLVSKGFLVVQVKPIIARPDIAGCRLLQVFDVMKDRLDKEGFGVVECDWFWDKKQPALFWFKLRHKQLPAIAEHKGPPLSLRNAVKAFKSKYKKTFNKDGFVWAKIKREHLSPESLVKDLFRSDYIKDKVSSIKLV